jgi:hypothetical protein
MTQQTPDIAAQICGLEPLATSTKHLFYTQDGFVMVKNGNVDRISHQKAQKFLAKNAPEIQMYKLHPQLLYR